MVNEPEVIKQQMEETRSSLADKLETLEQHVLGTVHDTTSAVSNTAEMVTDAVEGTVESVKETVENVKESFMETVESVKETVRDTFDLRLQAERHPWGVVGGSVAVGFAVGYLMPKLVEGSPRAETNGHRHETARSEPAAEGPSFLKAAFFAELLGPELERLKTYAMKSLKEMVHDFIVKSVPGYENPQGNDSEGQAAQEPWRSQ